MEISQEPIPSYTMYVKFSHEELKNLASDAKYIGANLELSVPMDLLLTSLWKRWNEINDNRD